MAVSSLGLIGDVAKERDDPGVHATTMRT